MNLNFSTFKQQAQDFVLRLFVETSSGSNSSTSLTRRPHYYTCTHAGTHTRLHQ